ncbi:glycerate kinase [Proteus faecis]|uniref:Glycerate kinase n=2 Tax=Proteus TaxID=583 RepID=A0AAW7CYI7_9GAMM|nr:glycerate kinase [Proteus faecis]MDL5168173.1 glycerate kinase [Proteus faecis]MDL5276158.1 glycerate kinase [Proteus faecis]MDL5279768.1 glycerate kinase [Proteus faecis]MDL5308770.1 glycerate kinase [Proteus faecis]MDL5312332.1 glycerate kinase [Proteus faecis]
MKIVIAPDSFKESLSAKEVATAIKQGFSRYLPNAQYCCIPMADGGEGTVTSLVEATQGRFISTHVCSPLGKQVTATWGILGDNSTAVIEMAQASGLHLIPSSQRNPNLTTSYGTGELINAALEMGVKKIILGLGGSATNDAGAGMMQALGLGLKDKLGSSLPFGGQALTQLHSIDITTLNPKLKQAEIEIACDVTNPLCGENGASAIFGPQKGATKDDIAQLDKALLHFGTYLEKITQRNLINIAGSGAAGGLALPLLAFTQATLSPGIELVAKAVELEKYFIDADLVITGEGRMDSQSAQGKTPIGVALLAKKYHRPVIALVGGYLPDYGVVHQQGIDAVFSIVPGVSTLDDALRNAQKNLSETAYNVARLYTLRT